MGTVIMHNVVSLDGFIADDNDDPGPLHEWYFSGDTPITDDADPRFDQFRRREQLPGLQRVGALRPGHVGLTRRDRDGPSPVRPDQRVGGASADGRARSRGVAPAQAEGWHPEASYHFVDDPTAAIFGSGRRYFGQLHGQQLLEDPDVLIQGERVLRLKFKVRRVHR